jgi:ribosome-binding protein aMBF1 (putative translation factor)
MFFAGARFVRKPQTKAASVVYLKTVDSLSPMVIPWVRMNRRQAQIQRQFGERIRELRKEKGLSQEGLALACDLDRSYVGGVERGERNISLLNIYKMARALGVSPSELFVDPGSGQR